MPRPVRSRKISNPPKMSGFVPYGALINPNNKSVRLHYDEFESIRLVTYLNTPQEEAAGIMGISRPTLTRVYNSALGKIAKAFIECLPIEIEGGSVEFSGDWYKCKKCYKLINGLENHIKCSGCESFSDLELIKINE